MDFQLSDDQRAIAEMAGGLFETCATIACGLHHLR